MFKMTKRGDGPAVGPTAVEAFIEAARRTPAQRAGPGRGRLIFALDATMSRQPTWTLAAELQGRMFDVAEALGGLDVQLVYYRGFGECRASPFMSHGAGLAAAMRRLRVAGGPTQIGRVIAHGITEARRDRVGALVFVGDALEERAGDLCAMAGQLALLGTKLFMFQEGRDRHVTSVFQEMARVTNGAHGRFDASAPDVLASLLSAAAAYAAGGLAALEALADRSADAETRRLLAQIR